MRNRLARLAILVLALAGLSAPAQAAAKAKGGVQPAPSPEEGTWKVKVTPDPDTSASGEKESEDTLVLKKGMFHSLGCDPYGFSTAPYRIAGNTWMSNLESKTDGKIHWHGEASGDSITGKMTWTKLDGTVLSYSFSGTRASDMGSQTQPSRAPENTKN